MTVILGVVFCAVMHLVRHSVTQRMTLVGFFCLGLAGFVPFAEGQTNLDADGLQPEHPRNLSSLAAVVRWFFWCFGATLLVIAGALFALRSRVDKNLYKTAPDAHWDADAQEEAAPRIETSEVMEACEALKSPPQPAESAESAAEANPPPQVRLFVPASGPAWSESMLRAFLGTCMNVNCLGRTWRESAALRGLSPGLPDPREAELIRRLMLRWPEFHVDPESGVFLDHYSSTEKSRVCIIRVSKSKRTLVEAAFNAGFVIESVGRYLKRTDLVYRCSLGDYHAPTRDELAAMTPGEKNSLMRITEVPDPWQAMIASSKGRG
jgi:hypothetical protein